MKVKLLNIHQLGSKLIIVKALHEIGKMGLKEAKDCIDDLFARGEKEVTIDVKTTKSATKKLLDELGINYVFVDDGLEDIIDVAKKIENAGVYLIPTEMGIQIVIVVHIPNEQLLISQLKGIFKDAHFDVGTKEIEDGKSMRLLFSKMFPNGAVSLDDINELAENAKNILNAYWIHRDFRELGKIVDNMVKEAFEKIGW